MLRACKKALKLDSNQAEAWYYSACVYARKGDQHSTLCLLAKAIELNGDFREFARHKEDFDALREDQDFIDLVGRPSNGGKLC